MSNINNEKEVARLRVDQPLKFEHTLETMITSTFDISKTVNQLFKAAFDDYEGCVITPNHLGNLDVKLYFVDNGGKQMVPLIDRNGAPSRSMNERIKNMNSINKNKTYRLSDETLEILSEFVETSGGMKNKINWNMLVSEVADPTYNGYRILMQVSSISINKILRTLYGNKSENGNYIDYMLQIVRPVSQSASANNTNFLVTVLKLDQSSVEGVAKRVGIIPTSGTIPMIRV